MSRTLRALIEKLRRDVVVAPPYVFQAGRERQNALGAYTDPASVLAALAVEDDASYPERERLLQALVLEHQAKSHALWASMLIVAFYPMLSRLRGRILSDALTSDELDQVVITSFLTALSRLTTRQVADRVPLRLRQRTTRQVFKFLRREREHQLEPLETEDLVDVPEEPTGGLWDDVATLLQRAHEMGISASSLDVLRETVLRREHLRAYVERIGPEEGQERERMYQRLKRQRSRAMQRLRSMPKPLLRA
jgi:hypothetical protein